MFPNGNPQSMKYLLFQTGKVYESGTLVGSVGNSGTTLVPHLHLVWGFVDNNERYAKK